MDASAGADAGEDVLSEAPAGYPVCAKTLLLLPTSAAPKAGGVSKHL